MEEFKRQGNASDHLANERTFLAWIRTSVGIMAFGFVVVKFSLFVKQISLILGKADVVPSKGYSGILGIILVGVGTITAVLSYMRYKSSARQLDEGGYQHSSLLITILTAFIFLVSVFLIVYLINSI
ncbi:DUF202 domain-containing protein [Ginsengibacter hankyongi]|uniref:DUF202 domain-containing protein n=1 Tax=Ginsengibacter hankyongi TaxID=2607284 RepID=A0A5J5IHW2_9BACT|nr:DUF202 domain-containing protein [Ginsengibacter hankyongi]KAA9040590.1 DUF202 domain-containing protein [Ginsengibacter hankyongi]